jgi:hypothetical protein
MESLALGSGAKAPELLAFPWFMLGSPLWSLTQRREVRGQVSQLQLHLLHMVL